MNARGIFSTFFLFLQAVIKQAEGTLKTLQSHPGFGIAVLKVGKMHSDYESWDTHNTNMCNVMMRWFECELPFFFPL